jgi:hypothetical protein
MCITCTADVPVAPVFGHGPLWYCSCVLPSVLTFARSHRRRDVLETIYLLAQINVTSTTQQSARSAIFTQMDNIANTFLNSKLDTESFFPANSARTGPAGVFCTAVAGCMCSLGWPAAEPELLDSTPVKRTQALPRGDVYSFVSLVKCQLDLVRHGRTVQRAASLARVCLSSGPLRTADQCVTLPTLSADCPLDPALFGMPLGGDCMRRFGASMAVPAGQSCTIGCLNSSYVISQGTEGTVFACSSLGFASYSPSLPPVCTIRCMLTWSLWHGATMLRSLCQRKPCVL